MIKKRFLLLFCVLILSLVGCSNDSNKENINRQSDSNQVVVPDGGRETETDSEEDFEDEEDFSIEEVIFDKELQPFFMNYKEGCIVIRYDNTKQGISYHEELSEVQRSPLSTFKILSTIILLEEKIVTDVDQVIPWDGTIYQNESWNANQTLRSAFENSVVWVYKKLLSNVDDDTIANYLDRSNYGNKDISGGEGFWLDSSLKISLKEQIIFLEGLYYNKFNFNQNVIEKVKELMLINQTENYKIYGKTGSSNEGTNLFVGFIESQEDVFFFATYVNEENAGYNVAKEISCNIAESLFLE